MFILRSSTGAARTNKKFLAAALKFSVVTKSTCDCVLRLLFASEPSACSIMHGVTVAEVAASSVGLSGTGRYAGRQIQSVPTVCRGFFVSLHILTLNFYSGQQFA